MLILFYRSPIDVGVSVHDQLDMDNIADILPADVKITYDRSLLPDADAVVFYVPFLPRDLEHDIEKPEGQIWVGWSYECEVNHPWMFSDEMKDIFDLWMTYHLDSDIVLPYYDYSFSERLYLPTKEKRKDICMLISSPFNDSHRFEYLSELMKYVRIDSYGRWMNNCKILNDSGYRSKIETIKDYKFTIAFENAVARDYVTEKFFEPLIVGSVPVYMGAPNIETFAPGYSSYIDIRDFSSPKELAMAIREYCIDRDSYNTMFEWKKHPLKAGFQKLLNEQRTHPFVRMADKIRQITKKTSVVQSLNLQQ